MTFIPEIHHRHSIRLKGYDYSQAGYYYVTICTQDRNCVFGEIINGKMMLNESGKIVENCWFDLPNHYNNIELNEFIIMPNHFHGIICITMGTGDILADCDVGAGLKPAPTKHAQTSQSANTKSTNMKSDKTNGMNVIKQHGLPEIVRALKTFSSRRINEMRQTQGMPVWQRNYYEHIIRDDVSYYKISEYILNNPANWDKDDYYGC
jgi:putative transposase